MNILRFSLFCFPFLFSFKKHQTVTSSFSHHLQKQCILIATCFQVLNPSSLERLCRDKHFQMFLTDLVLLNPNRAVRVAGAEQFIVICTCGSSSRFALSQITPLLFSLLDTLVLDNARTSQEFFQLLCRLVNCMHLLGVPFPTAEALLASEVAWLRRARNQHEVSGITIMILPFYLKKNRNGTLCMNNKTLMREKQ